MRKLHDWAALEEPRGCWRPAGGCGSLCSRHVPCTQRHVTEVQEEEACELVAAMVEANGLESLVLRLGNLDEGVAEEDAAVLNALSTLENMIELQPSVLPAAQHQCASMLLCWGALVLGSLRSMHRGSTLLRSQSMQRSACAPSGIGVSC